MQFYTYLCTNYLIRVNNRCNRYERTTFRDCESNYTNKQRYSDIPLYDHFSFGNSSGLLFEVDFFSYCDRPAWIRGSTKGKKRTRNTEYSLHTFSAYQLFMHQVNTILQAGFGIQSCIGRFEYILQQYPTKISSDFSANRNLMCILPGLLYEFICFQ